MPTMLARYEFKYLITEEQADWIREVVRCHCEPDPYGDNGNYSVNSLYLDTPGWLTARQTLEGVRHRFKLRVRTYGWTMDDPVFLEDKGRVGTSIVKARALMSRDQIEPLLKGEVRPQGYRALKASHQDDLEAFRNRMDQLDMRPRLWVRYTREAWGSIFGDGARLTFDRHVEVQAPDHDHPYVPDHTAWTRIPLWDAPLLPSKGPPLILEMKFNGASPYWMTTIVHELHLLRLSVSKYVRGGEHLGDVPWNRWEKGSRWTA